MNPPRHITRPPPPPPPDAAGPVKPFTHDLITTDRKCRSCGYNLRGLEIGKPCPECGTPIKSRFRAAEPDKLVEAPIPTIRLLSTGLFLLALGAWGVILSLMAASLGLFSPPIGWIGAGALWFAGVVVTCIPWPAAPGRERDVRWRRIVRWLAVFTQGGWLVAAALATIALTSGSGGSLGGLASFDLTAIGLAASLIIALAGFGPTGWLLAWVAEWVGDPDRGRRLRYATGWIVILSVLVVLGVQFRLPIGVPVLSLMIGGVDVIAAALVCTALYLAASLTHLAIAAKWAITVAEREAERVENLRAKAAQERAEHAAKLRDQEPFGGPVGPLGTDNPTQAGWRAAPKGTARGKRPPGLS